MLLAVGLFGLMTVVFAYSRWVPLSVFALAVLGGADMVSVFTRQSLVQIATPDRMRGRVSAVATLVHRGVERAGGVRERGHGPGAWAGRRGGVRRGRGDGGDGDLGLAVPDLAEGGSPGYGWARHEACLMRDGHFFTPAIPSSRFGATASPLGVRPTW